MNQIGKLILYIFLSSLIYPNVVAKVDNQFPNKGDMITLDIVANGDDISFPTISQIGGNKVVSISSSRSLSIINGERTSTTTKSFSFYPQVSFVIPSFSIMISNQSFLSNKVKINVSTNQNSSPSFTLKLQLDKNDLFVSESTKLRLLIIRDRDFKVMDISISKPNFPDLWVKNEDVQEPYAKGNKIIQEIVYDMSPQKAGDISIAQFVAEVIIPSGRRDFFGRSTGITKKFFSNSLHLNINELPNGVDSVGDFTIESKVDKTKMKTNDSVSFEVIIKGKGNLEDIEAFKLSIPNTSVYSSKPKIEDDIFRQVFTLVSDTNFTIPSIEFKYFFLKDKTTITKRTKKINIEVYGKRIDRIISTNQNQVIKNIQEIEVKEVIIYKDPSITNKLIYVLIGIFITMISYFLIKLLKGIISKSSIKKFYIPSDEKELLSFLMTYRYIKRIEEYIELIERNIYKKEKNIINLKEIKWLIKNEENHG